MSYFQEFIEKVETFRPLINELNERSHDLDKEAAEKSHQLINELMTNVNHRWKELVGQTENKQMILQVINKRNHPFEQAYEGCSNMNASSFITFFTYKLRQNVIPLWKELFVAFKMAPNIKKHSLYFSSYRPLFKGHSCILKFF